MKTRCVNRELTIEMIVGSFMASIFAVLVLFTIVISGGRFSTRRHTLEIHFDEIIGLRRHDNVLVRGMSVGTVREMTLDPDAVRVLVVLREPVQMREGYGVYISGTSLLGGSQLIIETGQGDPLPPDTVLRGETPPNFMRDVSEFAYGARQSLLEGGTLDNIQRATHDLAEIIARVERGEGTVGRLLAADDTLYRNLDASIADLRLVAERLQRGESLIGKLLADDDGFYADLRSTAGSLRQVSERLEQGEGALGRLLAADESLYTDLSAAIASLRTVAGRLEAGEGALGRLLSAEDTLYDEVLVSATNLRLITTRLESGEGTLGRLLSADDTLYRDVAKVVENAREALDDLRESSPILTFSSILFGAF